MPDAVELGLILTEEAANHSEGILAEIMKAARQGYSHSWYKENWRSVVVGISDVVLEDLDLLAPWIETWIDLAYSRIEKENNK